MSASSKSLHTKDDEREEREHEQSSKLVQHRRVVAINLNDC